MNVEELKNTITGNVLLPNDQGYDEARTLFMAKGTPAIVIQPRTASDVAAAITFAKKEALELSIKSGGHGGAGFATNDGGVVIDLSFLNTVEILDEDNGHVRIGTGAHWKDVAEALKPHGLALSSGDTGSVGVGGLMTGGGIGWMVRKYGLAIDSLVAAEVVTAQGEILQTHKTENSDLFWAIRGGGSNFGIVTYFDFTAHHETDVYAGMITYSQDNLAEKLRGWRDSMRSAPRELTTMFTTLPPFGEGMEPIASVTLCFAGSDETAAHAAIEPLEKLGNVVKKDWKKKPYKDVLEEAHPPQGMRVISNNIFIQDLTDEGSELIAKEAVEHKLILQIRAVGGAMNDVASDATAFAHRDSEMLIVHPTFIPPNADSAAIQKALEPWNRIARLGHGSYSNLLSEVNEVQVAAVYPEATYQRLAKIKQKYDPENIFHHNYNIQPSKS